MWRKPLEVKPSPVASTAPATASVPTPSYSPASSPPASLAPKKEPVVEGPAASTFTAATVEPRANAGDSRISAGLKISGEISGSSDLFIDGDTQGKIRFVRARVTVGPNGKVQADIEAREIVVQGTVRGNLKASERIQLSESSRVQGILQTPRLGIEDGAKLRGKVDMTRSAESRSNSAVEKPAEKSSELDVLKPVTVLPDPE